MLTLPLHSPRLALREFQADDLAAYQTLRGTPAFGRCYAPAEVSPAFSAMLLRRFIAQQDEPRRAWQLAIARRGDGQLIGSVGLREACGGEAEFGIELAETAWGRGYAEEAARLMLGFGRQRLACSRFRARCAPGNVAMLMLAMRLGFEMQPLRDGRRLDLLLAA